MKNELETFLQENYEGGSYVSPKSFQHYDDRELYWKFRVNLKSNHSSKQVDRTSLKILKYLLNKNIEHKTWGGSTVIYPKNLAQAEKAINCVVPLILENPDITENTNVYDTELIKGLSTRYEVCVKDMPGLVEKVIDAYEPISAKQIGEMWDYYPTEDKQGNKLSLWSQEFHDTAEKLKKTKNTNSTIKRHNKLNSKLKKSLEEHIIKPSSSHLLPYNSAITQAPFHNITLMIAATKNKVEPALYKLTYMRQPRPYEKEMINDYFKVQEQMKKIPDYKRIIKHVDTILHRS